MTAGQRAQYRDNLKAILADLEKLAPEVPEKNRVRKIARCLKHVIGDLEAS